LARVPAALAAADEIEGWFRRWPDANVGLVTGRVSGLVVVDIDPRHGGQASLERLRDEHGPLPRTVEAETGGGGRHLYFAYPGVLVHNRVGILPGIDLRADGGCVVAPPSRHPSGRRYRWAEGSSPDDLPLAAMPAWLLPAADVDGHAAIRLRTGANCARRRRRGQAQQHAGLACRPPALARVDPPVVLELLHAFNRVRCRPPLPDDEVAQVVASITRLHERGATSEPSVHRQAARVRTMLQGKLTRPSGPLNGRQERLLAWVPVLASMLFTAVALLPELRPVRA